MSILITIVKLIKCSYFFLKLNTFNLKNNNMIGYLFNIGRILVSSYLTLTSG